MLKTIIKPINKAVQGNLSNSLACIQCVGYHRKPRWVPQAKSKIFKVPERKKQDEDEAMELQRIHNIYKTQVRAVRSYLLDEVKLKKATSTGDSVVFTPEEEAADMKQCIELNNAWNASISEIRNQRLEKQMNEKREFILSRLEVKAQRKEDALRAAEELVRIEKERSKTYILKENLDQAIEYALAHPVDYNFGINLNEEILPGRTSTDSKENQTAVATSQ